MSPFRVILGARQQSFRESRLSLSFLEPLCLSVNLPAVSLLVNDLATPPYALATPTLSESGLARYESVEAANSRLPHSILNPQREGAWP